LLADVAAPAYLAATVRAIDLIPEPLRSKLKEIEVGVVLPQEASPLEHALFNALTSYAKAAVARDHQGVAAPNHAGAEVRFASYSVKILIEEAYKDGEYITDYQHQLTAVIKAARLDSLLLDPSLSHEDRVRIRSSGGGVGNSWTRAIPYCDWDPSKLSPLHMPAADIRIAVCRLLGLGMGPGLVLCTKGQATPQVARQVTHVGPLWGHDLRCDCAAHSPFDPDLVHVHGCARGGLPTKVHDAIKETLCKQANSVRVAAELEVATGEVIEDGQVRPRKDADVLIKQKLNIHRFTGTLLAIDVKTHGAANDNFTSYHATDFLPSNPANPHLKHMTSHAASLISQRRGRQQPNTDFTIYSMDSFGGTTKLTDDILSAIAEAGSAKGKWEGKAPKLYRKFQTMQSVVLARTYANQATLRATFLRQRPFNQPQPPAVVPPLLLPLATALAHLRDVSYEMPEG
jgi:hypothetical protein